MTLPSYKLMDPRSCPWSDPGTHVYWDASDSNSPFQSHPTESVSFSQRSPGIFHACLTILVLQMGGGPSPGNQTTCTKPLSNGDFTAVPRCLPHHCEKQRLLKPWLQVQDSHQKPCEKWACFGPTDILQVCLGHGFQSMLHGASRGLGVFSGPGKGIRHKGKNPVSSHPDVN